MTDSPLRRVTREPALILGVLVAAFGVLVVFGVDITRDQIGAVVTLAGAVMAVLRFVLTPSSEVVVQQTPAGPVAGEASVVATGAPVAVSVAPVARDKRDDAGAGELMQIAIVTVGVTLGIIIAVALRAWLR